jgi:hypothetical protein
MTTRTRMLSLTVALSVLPATGVFAQTRMEPATSVFTYEALGATPRLQLSKRAPDENSVQPKAAPADRASEPPRSSVLTYDALGATPKIRTSKPAPVPATAETK